MAIHKLGSLHYRDLEYNKDLWKSEDTTNIGYLVNQLDPPVVRVTSLSENKAFAWFFGKVQVEGEGEVRVKYPYKDSSRDLLKLRNVNFSSYPYLLLTAEAEKGWCFKGWYDSVTRELLYSNPSLMLSENFYPDVTGFVLKFEKDEDYLGI